MVGAASRGIDGREDERVVGAMAANSPAADASAGEQLGGGRRSRGGILLLVVHEWHEEEEHGDGEEKDGKEEEKDGQKDLGEQFGDIIGCWGRTRGQMSVCSPKQTNVFIFGQNLKTLIGDALTREQQL